MPTYVRVCRGDERARSPRSLSVPLSVPFYVRLLVLLSLFSLFSLFSLALLDTGGLFGALALAVSVTAVAGTALAVCSLIGSRRAPAVPPTRVRTALRDRRRRTAFLPQRDPDAKGRRRPRAPGHALPTTVA
ncbi:DUF6412 domain-containing protein [Streptomyces sp. NPDC091377]|uniref:DUF6412 domain-containing protein n=1 Tax=Streptomyces sp. NPDC091377 TaxID=3365995 RepID=UPI0037F70118